MAQLFELISSPDLDAPVVVLALEGWIDAGYAAASALSTIKDKAELTTIATLEASPIPSHTMNSGASAIRGVALKTTMSGWNSPDRYGKNANSIPTMTPPTMPTARPTTASWTVASTWG